MIVQWIQRQGKVLTPSNLRCLSEMPTVNLTNGCVHDCIYCYIRGYSQYPGESTVQVYRDTAGKIAEELKRKRKKPTAVYFSPSSDAFMPVPQVHEQAWQTMRLLLTRGIGVQFVTKGLVPESILKLFAQYPNLVSGQMGLCTTDDCLNAILEPNAPSASQRLACMTQLMDIGVKLSVRVDPLIYGVTDTASSLDELFHRIAKIGIDHVSVSYLFLRPAIMRAIKSAVTDDSLRQRVLSPYFTVDNNQRTTGQKINAVSLFQKTRADRYAMVRSIAQKYGLATSLCGCKNLDMTTSRCRLTDLTVHARSQSHDAQLHLW